MRNGAMIAVVAMTILILTPSLGIPEALSSVDPQVCNEANNTGMEMLSLGLYKDEECTEPYDRSPFRETVVGCDESQIGNGLEPQHAMMIGDEAYLRVNCPEGGDCTLTAGMEAGQKWENTIVKETQIYLIDPDPPASEIRIDGNGGKVEIGEVYILKVWMNFEDYIEEGTVMEMNIVLEAGVAGIGPGVMTVANEIKFEMNDEGRYHYKGISLDTDGIQGLEGKDHIRAPPMEIVEKFGEKDYCAISGAPDASVVGSENKKEGEFEITVEDGKEYCIYVRIEGNGNPSCEIQVEIDGKTFNTSIEKAHEVFIGIDKTPSGNEDIGVLDVSGADQGGSEIGLTVEDFPDGWWIGSECTVTISNVKEGTGSDNNGNIHIFLVLRGEVGDAA